MAKLPHPSQHRKSDHDVLDLFVHRWSPRAMSGEPVSEAELHRLFEAARWAPSSYNEQPWRFLYAQAGSPHWPLFFDLLMDANKAWCSRAGTLLLIVSKKTFSHDNRPNPVHVFDSGSAWENLALQGSVMGLVVHGMAGFDFDKARTVLKIPDSYDVCAMAAIGRPGDTDVLPETYRRREVPTGRKSVKEIAFEGTFPET